MKLGDLAKGSFFKLSTRKHAEIYCVKRTGKVISVSGINGYVNRALSPETIVCVDFDARLIAAMPFLSR